MDDPAVASQNPTPAAPGSFPEKPVHRPGPWLAILGALTLLLLLGIGWEIITWPDVGSLLRENPTSTAFIRRDDRKNHRTTTLAWTSWSALSPNLKRAVLVSEDINFFTHDGFDRAEMKKALDEAMRDHEIPRGASTITQQLARNLWLSPARNPLRKVKEAMLTRQLERTLTKRRILEIYLNVVEFGPGTWGATAASARFFGTSPSNLDEQQAAELASGLSRPSSWHPGVTTRGYRRQVERVLGRMAKASFLRRQVGAPPETETPDTLR